MKISKKLVNIQSCNDTMSSKLSPNTCNDKEQAIEYILSAIHALGESALEGDEIAKDSIANLGVVLLDLK